MTTSAPGGPTPPDNTAPEDTAPSGADAGDTQALLRELASSIALLPQAPPAEGEERPEGAVALPVIEQDGTRYIPVFTSEAALQAAGGDPGTAIRIPVAQLAANWPSNDVWLAVNPASEAGLGLPPDVVRALPAFAGSQDEGGGSEPG
jgi:hypothetical protein